MVSTVTAYNVLALSQWILIVFLSQRHSSPTFRKILWISALSTTGVSIMGTEERYELTYWIAIGPGTRWAFKDAPKPHPLPRPAPYLRKLLILEGSQIWRTVDLMFNFRLVNLPPNPSLGAVPATGPAKAESTASTDSSASFSSNPHRRHTGAPVHTYSRHLIHHLVLFLPNLIICDILFYLMIKLSLLTPNKSYPLLRQAIFNKYGIPPLLADALNCLNQCMSTYSGMQIIWHGLAFIGIGSGLWIGEEWPKLLDRPWLAESCNDFWGRRWHQILREPIAFILSSLLPSSTPRGIYYSCFFIVSGLIHCPLYFPLAKAFHVLPFFTTFTLYGVGCILERIFKRITGKKVGGWSGRVWTWCWLGFSTWWSLATFWEPMWEAYRASVGPDGKIGGSIVDYVLDLIKVRA
ncbi:hypothetical protein IAT40_006560 [Kwoniella sp. CBS 6097]